MASKKLFWQKKRKIQT